MEIDNRQIIWLLIAIGILFLGLLYYLGIDLQFKEKAIGERQTISESINKLYEFAKERFIGLGISLGVIDDKITTVCSYKPTAVAMSNQINQAPKNCRPLTTMSGYGLVDCPQEGMTTYYCKGKVTTKAIASCCNRNINTGECS